MQTAEAETATPDQLRRGATLIVTFPLWPLHFPSIPAFNPSGGGGGGGSRSPKTKRHRRTTRRKKKRKEKGKKNPQSKTHSAPPIPPSLKP